MKYRKLGFLLVLMPGLAMAQERAGVATGSSASDPAATSPLSPGEGPGVRANAATLAVLLANRPKDLTEDQWLRMMQQPENAVLFPLRITQAMLDTLDGREMDLRFRYVLIQNGPQRHGPRTR